MSILDALDAEFASSTKPSRATCTKKIWTIKRTLTEADMGSLSLRARVGTKYGDGPASAAKTLTVTDNLPRVISFVMETTTAKRGAKLEFVVVTNLAATSVRILNDRGRSGSCNAESASGTGASGG